MYHQVAANDFAKIEIIGSPKFRSSAYKVLYSRYEPYLPLCCELGTRVKRESC